MHHTRKPKKGKTPRGGLFFCLLACLAIVLALCSPARAAGYPQQRPDPPQDQLHDPSGRMDQVAESAVRLLQSIRQRHGLDAALVLLPELPPGQDVSKTAAELFSAWRLGGRTHGRAVLVLVDLAGKQVKVEVPYALEHVFTDLLVGEIEDRQLRPYFLSGDLYVGLIAVLEEFEKRAAVLARGGDRAAVADLDAQYLSGGAGARLDLGAIQAPKTDAGHGAYPAGETPEQAWQTLLSVWRDGVRDPDLGIYTPLGRLSFRDYTARPASSLQKDWRTWSAKDYRILADDDAAVVSFGNEPGWDNAPFLFCRTPDGWRFDLVRQRRWIRMGSGTAWGWEKGDHPHAPLLGHLPSWMGQDIPMRPDDVYRTESDADQARRILELEQRLEAAPQDNGARTELGRLLTVTAMGRKALPLLEQARKADPEDPDARWYLAVANVDAHYQYGRASKDLEAYVALRPDDQLGWAFLGYARLMNDDPADAVEALEQALELDPDNAYVLEKLARAHAARWKEAFSLDPRKWLWKSDALEAQDHALPHLSKQRAQWLERDFKRMGLTD